MNKLLIGVIAILLAGIVVIIFGAAQFWTRIVGHFIGP
jgi:hypothetical protein